MDYICPTCGCDLAADTIDTMRALRATATDWIEVAEHRSCPGCAAVLTRPGVGQRWSAMPPE